MTRFALLTAPGMSSAAAHELAIRDIPVGNLKTLWLRSHDVLLFDTDQSELKQLLRLRTVDDIFLILEEEVAVESKADLRRLTPKGLRKDILAGLPLLPPRRQKRITTHFAVFVKQDADHEVYRKEIEHVLAEYLQSQFARWKVSDPADVEFWAFYVKKRVTVGLRLTRASFRQRRYKFEERPGALRPTVAGALVAFSDPKPDDVVLDPMCGLGTILLERGLWGETAKLIGCDSDAEALEAAGTSAEGAKVEVEWRSGDSVEGDLLEDLVGGVSKIICNLPFGKQYQPTDLAELYRKALKRWKPLLRAKGEMVLLTSQDDALRAAAKKAALHIRKLDKLRLKGLEASIYLLRHGG